MRSSRILMVLTAITIGIFSCQKELNFDLSGVSAGTLKKDSLNECLGAVVNGYYEVDSTLINENYIDVQVDVTTTGTYVVETDTVNGYSFRGTGTFGLTGINTVRIYGSGSPILQGVNTFIVRYDSSFCLVDVIVNAGGTPPAAVYTFAGAGGTCTASALTGVYMEGLALTPANTSVVQINVTSAGSYTISTDTINGVSFNASGVIAVGTANIILIGSGTPVAAGTFNYLVSGSGNGCSFAVTFDPPAAPAVYTLGGAPGGCTGATLGGSLSVGVPATPANSIEISVNVTTVGAYTISSNALNGITYSGSGLFTTTGAQNVTLYATGTPAAAGAFDYDLTGNASTCSVSVPVSSAPLDYITCDMDGVPATFNVNATAGLDNSPTGQPILSIDGSVSTTAPDPSIHLQIEKLFGGGSIVAGTYTVNQLTAGYSVTGDYIDGTGATFFAAPDLSGATQTPAFTITITSLTSTRVSGTFSGPLKPPTGVTTGINITNGLFSVPLQ